MIIAVDFDGTIVTHEYPEIGKDIGAIPILKRLVEKGHQLILYTMRSNEYLEEAVKYLKKNKIDLWGINENPDQHKWTESPKIYAQMYIDDAALGVPLEKDFLSSRPYVDWLKVEYMLECKGII